MPKYGCPQKGNMKSNSSKNPVRVLLIDDEPAFTRMLRLNLEDDERFVIGQVNESAKALSRALDFKPDIIFLDIVMPEADGGDVAMALRSNGKLKDIPIVFLSAIIPKRQHPGVYSSGGDMLLPKPVSAEQLIECIETVLQGKVPQS